jgi:hypothetical protein
VSFLDPFLCAVCGNPAEQATIATQEGTVLNPCPKAIYRTKPRCFIHRRRCRKLNLYHLKYDSLYHESLILDGKHDLVVLCEPVHLAFHAWAERLRVQPNAGILVLYQRDLQFAYGFKTNPRLERI